MTITEFQTRAPREPAIAISAERMMADLALLAAHTKHAGTASERESLGLLEARMAAAGFATRMLMHDAYISLPGAASLRVGGRDLTCITHSMAAATPAGGVAGELVDLGAGDAEAFASRPVAGRLVLVDGIASPGVAVRATQAGALGVIHVSPHEHLHEMCLSPVWGNPSLATRDALPAVPVVTVCALGGAVLRALLGQGPVVPVLEAAVDTGWRQTPLLVAEMAAPDAQDAGFVLLSAHHDTWHHGVMDNGSANVAVVEVARDLAARRAEWRRGLRVCFWSGHSQGRYSGSAWYADNHWDDLDRNCVAHVNLDSPGGIGAGTLTGTGVMAALRPLAALAIHAETGQRLRGVRKARSADESLQSLGVPSMFGSLSGQDAARPGMRNRLGWWWHTPQDLLDKIDPENLARDARVVWRCLHPLLCEERLPLAHDQTLADLEAELAGLAPQLAGQIDLGPVQALAADSRAAAASLSGPAATVNAALQQVSRLLVPLDYGHGDRFGHQPALPIAAWPVLDPLRRLAQVCAMCREDDIRFARVDAVRALNRLRHHLTQVADCLAGAAEAAGTR